MAKALVRKAPTVLPDPSTDYWQSSAPGDAGGDANTVSQLWSGAATATTFTWSVKLSATASKVRLVVSRLSDLSSGRFYSKHPVASADGHAKSIVEGLVPNTTYYWGLLVDGVLKNSLIGRFKTAPDASAFSFKLALGGDSQNDNPASFSAIKTANPLLFIHTGDKHDNDTSSTDIADHFAAMDGMFADPTMADFYRTVPSLIGRGDHDAAGNGSHSGSTGMAASTAAHIAKVPYPVRPSSDVTYCALRLGRVVVVLLEGVAYRSDPAATDNSSKTMLGTTQKAWFKALLVDDQYDGCVFFPVFAEPWDGNAADTWSTYQTEQGELVDYFAANSLTSRLMGLGGGAHCIAIDSGTHVNGGFPYVNAGPLEAAANSTKGLTVYDQSYATVLRQFCILDVADAGGDTIAVTVTAHTAAGAVLGTATYNLTP